LHILNLSHSLSLVAGGLLLMEMTKFVVAVTQHVVLMLNLPLIPMEVCCFYSKVSFEVQVGLLLGFFFFLGIQWEGKASLGPVMVQEQKRGFQ